MTPVAQDVDLRSRSEELLRDLAGPEAVLRPEQWSVIQALLSGKRVLNIQKTGAGKTAPPFIASKLLRARGAGPTVFVSPLLALMSQQEAAAGRMGLEVGVLNSTNISDWEYTCAGIEADEIDLLLLSPERLIHPEFREKVLPFLTDRLGLLVIDETHSLSDWQNFRPTYWLLRSLIPTLPKKKSRPIGVGLRRIRLRHSD